MAARLLDHHRQSLPLQHGMLRVAGASKDPDSNREAHEIVVDGRGELNIVLLRLETGRGEVNVYGALGVVCDALAARRPIYEVVGALRAWCADPENDASVGLTLLRFAQPDSRIEVLNAGMPAVACIIPGGRVALHAPLSAAVGARLGDVHPYELTPLVWGSLWVVMSKGLTAGALDPEAVHARVLAHELGEKGRALAGLGSDELAFWLPRLAEGAFDGDGSLLVIHADPARRFQSGFR